MARQRMTLDKLAVMIIEEFQAVRRETAGGFAAVWGEIRSVRGEVVTLRGEMTGGLASVRREMADALTSVRQEMHDGFGAMGARLDRVEAKVDTALERLGDHETRVQRLERRRGT